MTDVWSRLYHLKATAERARLAMRKVLGTPEFPLRLAEYRQAMDAVCALRIQLRIASRLRPYDAPERRPLERRA